MVPDFGRPLGSGSGMPLWNSSNNLNHLPLPLNITFDAHHASTEDDTALFLIHFGPYDHIGDTHFIFYSDEHHTLGRSRPLVHQI
jgi:hypothetical protein